MDDPRERLSILGLANATMNNKWMRVIVIVPTALLVMAVVVRVVFWQSLLNILSGEFLR